MSELEISPSWSEDSVEYQKARRARAQFGFKEECKGMRQLTEEETAALGEDLHRHQELDDAIGELIKDLKLSAKRCGICVGPCPVFTPGATPCDLAPENFSDRTGEMHELLTEIIELRESKGLDKVSGFSRSGRRAFTFRGEK